MKIKSLAVTKLTLRYHPQLQQLISHDHLALSSPVDIQRLPLNRAQTLLDLSPILACKNPKSEADDWQLSPNLVFELLKHHQDNHKLIASVHYYPEALVDEVLICALMLSPALSYRQQSKLLSNLFYRAQLAKSLHSDTPSKKLLADWATVSPSAIRSR